ncbi:MAG: hypothetical protein HKP61_07740 [Dactylosporangium sp.]|nr:hypothetical protein [Dactylosporangium sp.]NNJ60828.1 hypothetical protein [Dactylosporangium sp.]
MLVAFFLLGACADKGTDPGVATAQTGQGDSASSGAGSGTDDRLRQYVQCLRDHGLDVPDPTPGQEMVRIDPKNPEDQAERALMACRTFAVAPEHSAQVTAADLAKLRDYAKCMRDHGVSNFPDPDPKTGYFPGLDKSNYDPNSEPVKSAIQACQALAPEVAPGG